jgi:hypothetical protein
MTMTGYARVSTLDQDLSLQLAAGIGAAKARGSIRGDRPRSMLELCGDGGDEGEAEVVTERRESTLTGQCETFPRRARRRIRQRFLIGDARLAVTLLDDVAQMNANPEDDAAILGHAGVALDHSVLNFDGAAHRVDDTAKLYDRAVAGPLDDVPVMNRNSRIDQVASERPQPRQNPVLIGSGKPRIADDVGH